MTISPHTILNTPSPEPAAPPRGSSFWRLAYYVTPAEAGVQELSDAPVDSRLRGNDLREGRLSSHPFIGCYGDAAVVLFPFSDVKPEP